MEKFSGLFTQFMNAFLQWVNKLIGGGVSKESAEQEPQSEKVNIDSKGRKIISEGEDPVAKDVQKLESVLEEKVGKAKESPVAKGMEARSKQVTAGVFKNLKNMITSSKSGGSGMLGKIIVLLVVVAFVVVIFNFSRGLLGRLNEENGQQEEVVGNVTPTLFIVQSSEPSIYADDEDILGLERDIGILENSMNDSTIRETRLNPPDLDFDISF